MRQEGSEPEGTRRASTARHALFAAAGALAIALQVILLRELMVALAGDESAVGLGLAAWLAGIAVGALLARRVVVGRPAFWMAAGFGLLALAGPVQVIAGRFFRLAMAPPAGELVSLGSSILISLVMLAPAGVLVGGTFTALAAATAAAGVSPGRGIARLYVFESIGSLAGGLAVTFLVVPFLSPLRGIALIAAACVALALPSAFTGTPGGRPLFPARGGILALGVFLAILSHPVAAGPLEDWSARARFEGLAPGIPLVAWTDTSYQHVAVGGDEVRHLYAGGQYAGSFPDPVSSEVLAHTLSCLAPRVDGVLALGGILTGPLRFLLKFPIDRIDVVEPDRKALTMLRRHLSRADAGALDDPRVRIVHDDPRRFLARSDGSYDLILALQPDPVTLLLSRMTSVEFYRLAAARLAPGGVLVQSLGTAPNVITGETAAMGGAIYGALKAVFPVVRAGPGPDGILLAGPDPAAATLDPRTLADRWGVLSVAARAFAPEMFGMIFPVERVRAQEAALARAAASVPASRDGRPVSFLHALSRRQRITGGLAGGLLSRLAGIRRPVLALLPLLPSLLVLAWITLGIFRKGSAHGRPGVLLRRAGVHAVGVTGACGMVWGLLLLFSFQTRAGALYGQLGLLTGLFMLGLALGGAAAARAASAPVERVRSWLLATSGLALAFAVMVALVLPVLGRVAPGALGLTATLHGSLLLLAGAVTGSAFPAAAGAQLAAGRGAADAAGVVESADHAAAAVAALLGAVLFIPVFGLTATAYLLAAMEGVAVAVVAMTPRPAAEAPGLR
jgi:spermidine synthase